MYGPNADKTGLNADKTFANTERNVELEIALSSAQLMFALIAIWLDGNLKCLTITHIREAKLILNCFWNESTLANCKIARDTFKPSPRILSANFYKHAC